MADARHFLTCSLVPSRRRGPDWGAAPPSYSRPFAAILGSILPPAEPIPARGIVAGCPQPKRYSLPIVRATASDNRSTVLE